MRKAYKYEFVKIVICLFISIDLIKKFVTIKEGYKMIYMTKY